MNHWILSYIDPGTGSMLFTIIIGLAATLIYALKGLRIKIKYLISGGKAKEGLESKVPYVIYSDNKRYWNVFKSICDEFEKRGIDVLYYTQSEDDPALSTKYEHIKAEFIGEGSKGFAKLNMLKAQTVIATTPGLDVYQWKRSKDVDRYIFITHSIDDGTVYRMFGLDHYDIVMQTGEFAKEKMRKLEKLRNYPEKEYKVVGSTYMDGMLEKYNERTAGETQSKKEGKTILLAPSWGESAILNKYGEEIIEALVDTGYNIVIRPHPQSFESEKELMEKLQTKFPESEKLSWNRDIDNFDCLNNSDIMISDFSAVVFDYAFIFNKPVIYADAAFDKSFYDAAWLPDEEIWTNESLKKFGKKLEIEDFPKLKEIIDEMISDKSYEERRNAVRDEGWQNKGKAAETAVEYIIETQPSLVSETRNKETKKKKSPFKKKDKNN